MSIRKQYVTTSSKHTHNKVKQRSSVKEIFKNNSVRGAAEIDYSRWTKQCSNNRMASNTRNLHQLHVRSCAKQCIFFIVHTFVAYLILSYIMDTCKAVPQQ